MTRVGSDPTGPRDLAVRVGTEAGEVLVEHARRGFASQTKSSATDPVTDADRASEQHVVTALLAARPDDGIVGEEEMGDRCVRDVRRGGSAARDLAWVAAGRVDGYWEYGLNEWDWAAAGLLVREAGGATRADHVDVHGQRLQVVAGNPAVVEHQADWADTTAAAMAVVGARSEGTSS